VVVGTFDVGHAVPWRTGGGGDAYVAFESVMRVHARRVGGGIGGGAVRFNETETFEKDGENGREMGEGSMRRGR